MKKPMPTPKSRFLLPDVQVQLTCENIQEGIRYALQSSPNSNVHNIENGMEIACDVTYSMLRAESGRLYSKLLDLQNAIQKKIKKRNNTISQSIRTLNELIVNGHGEIVNNIQQQFGDVNLIDCHVSTNGLDSLDEQLQRCFESRAKETVDLMRSVRKQVTDYASRVIYDLDNSN